MAVPGLPRLGPLAGRSGSPSGRRSRPAGRSLLALSALCLLGGLGTPPALALAPVPASDAPATWVAPGPAEPPRWATSSEAWFQRGIDLPARLQWNANFGYCGETSLISAGLHFGQYTSQWTARALASPGIPQYQERSQLLLGRNDRKAATSMKLAGRSFPTSRQRSSEAFLRWAKARFLRGDVVILGVYDNPRKLGEPVRSADAEYDHIVPLVSVGSTRPLRPGPQRFSATDVLAFSDNGLFSAGAYRPFFFQYSWGEFLRSRTEASSVDGPLYSLRDTPPNYGLAVSGVLDPEGVTVPVRLVSSLKGEGLRDEAIMTAPPPPRPLTLTATVLIPDPSVAYRVYLYDDFGDVPVRDFNARASRAVRMWSIPAGYGSRWSVSIDAESSDTRVFRAVPASAP